MSWTRALVGIGLVAASFIPGLNVALAIAFRVGGSLIGRSAGEAGERQESRLDNPISPTAPLPVIYGEQRVGMAISDLRALLIETPGDDLEILYLVGAIAVGSDGGTSAVFPSFGTGVQDVTAIWFDDIQVVNNPTTTGAFGSANVIGKYSGHLGYSIHLGSDTQAVDAELNSRFPTEWPSTSEGAGIAYIVLALAYDEEVYPSFPRITVTVQGQKVYDPDSETVAYSTNNALCVLDYVNSRKYGAAVPIARVDTASFVDSADYCDQVVDTTAYNGPRFVCTGTADTSSSRREVLEQLLASCRGEVILQGATYRMYIPKPETLETFELTEDNTVGDWEFARLGHVPNSITANFVDGDTHQTKEVTWPEAGQTNNFLTADNGFAVSATMQVSFVDNVYIAQQIAMVTLRENREDIVVSLRAHESALLTQVGEVVPLTHSTPGWNQKPFRVAKMGILPDCTVQLLLREYDANAYTLDTQNTQDTGTDTNLSNALVCQPPTALVLSSDDTTEVVVGGVRMTRIFVEWTAAAEPFLSHYEVRHRPTAETEWVIEPNVLRALVEAYTVPVDDTVNHTVEIRAVNTLGVPSVWVSATKTPGAIFYQAEITQCNLRIVGRRLWCDVIGDPDTRETGHCIIGTQASGTTPPDPTLGAFDFSLQDARSGEIDTGIDIPNPGFPFFTQVRARVAAVNGDGDVGPVVYRTALFIGSAASTGATIDTLTHTKVQDGTGCGPGDTAESQVVYAVTPDVGTDTVTIERWVDGQMDAVILNASTTHSDTIIDEHDFWASGGVGPKHNVSYHVMVKDSGGAGLVDQWSDEVAFNGITDC